MHLRATACLHCHSIDNWPARHRMATTAAHWAGLNVTTLPWCLVILRCVLSLRRPLPYGRTDGRTNGRTDKNRQTIAVTLRLGFAARVNKPYHALQVGHTRATDNYMYNFQRGDTVVMWLRYCNLIGHVHVQFSTWGHGSVTLFTRPFLPFCVGGTGHETKCILGA